MKKEYILPKKWCIKGTKKNNSVLEEYFKPYDSLDWDYSYGFFFLLDNSCRYSANIPSGYELITFKQFQQYILKTKPVKQKKQSYNYLIPILKKYNVI